MFSDQFQLQDVLARSDRAMAVVKDLFGDAPRRQTGMILLLSCYGLMNGFSMCFDHVLVVVCLCLNVLYASYRISVVAPDI